MSVLLQLTDAVKSYGDQMLLDDASVTLYENVKVGFVGRNGAGKSTLLRVLLGEEELDSGQVSRSPHLRIGYLRQHDPFLPDESAMDFLIRDSGQPDWKCGEVAAEFELKGEYLTGPVKRLSGGWQTRVKLAALLLHDPNLLMLEEPTNFLDLRTQILLEHFLRHFDAEAAELAARLHLHVAEAAWVHVAAVGVEALQHAVDRVLDHGAVSDGLDIFRADALEHIAEQVEQAIGFRPAAFLRPGGHQRSHYHTGGKGRANARKTQNSALHAPQSLSLPAQGTGLGVEDRLSPRNARLLNTTLQAKNRV